MAEQRSYAVVRERELAAVSALLDTASAEPAGLMIVGDAGIGKTTLWLSGCDDAAARGFRVLAAGGDPADVRLAFAGLADLLSDVDDAVIDQLPPVQAGALNRILLRGNDGPDLDERAAAAAFHGVVQRLAVDSPVLIAIDDVQWLDSSSATAVRFAIRRLSGAVAVLATARTGELAPLAAASWLQLPYPDAVTQLALSPLTFGGLHALIVDRLGRVPPRPTMVRIHEISAGNPLYALELARAAAAGRSIDSHLPDTLAALVAGRIAAVDEETRRVLLAAAATPAPTVEIIAAATETTAGRVVELLEFEDAAQLVGISGNQIRFAHPLLATGVYAGATVSSRRRIHRRLAECVEVPELKARHLASAAVSGDVETLATLDAAAAVTRGKGAPAAAAELVELAIALGGDTAARRICAAEHHFRAGNSGRARRLLQPAIDELPSGASRCGALMLLAAVLAYDDDTPAAVGALTQAADEAGDDTALRLHCLLRVALATVIVGHPERAVEYARASVALAEGLGDPELHSRALSIWVGVSFVHGLGVDASALQTALTLEHPHSDATTWFRASAVQAMICAWTGELHQARDQLKVVQRRMIEDGTELDIIWAANHLATVEVWLGRYAAAAQASRDALQRAEQMGGRQLLVTAWGWQAAIAAYTGDEATTRAAAGAAIGTARETGAHYLADAPTGVLGFLEVSLGKHDAALRLFEPLLAEFDPVHGTEIVVGSWLPDAMEALTVCDRVDEAERLVDALRANGTRLDRPWMLAMSARGAALCFAAGGDLPGAEAAAIEAIAHHQRLPMPFEMARTQLLLGALQRRRRRRQEAATTLSEALRTFETIGAPLWAERVRAELARLHGSSARAGVGLTPAERRIAQRAAAGLSNKEIAAEQFLAIKTVEMTLSSVYRKLGIRSRAQLHARLDQPDARETPGSPDGKDP